MYLKRLDLCGFKSFHEKTSLGFGPGIAAIIGPNGCGKSNLVDAIRWVLGEQSARVLRGTRMEEFIFAGTEQRKPLHFTEISLTLAEVGSRLNVDYDEVMITRRLYRSGESEYCINKAPCRLRDITEMLLDTGAGRDFYSVIGQGRVEEIINSPPVDRREIFEEAAGILKYKLRKREAQRRLEETRENMVRVLDLFHELGDQVKPLQEQAAQARNYRLLQEQQRVLERELCSYHLFYKGAELEQAELQLREAGSVLAALRVEEGKSEEMLFDLKKQQTELVLLLETEERELNRQMRKAEQAEAQLKVLQERADHAGQQQAEQERQRVEQGRRVRRLQEERERLQQEQTTNRVAASAVETRRRTFQDRLAELGHDATMHAVEKRRHDLHRVSSAAGALQAAAEELQRQVEQTDRRLLALEREAREPADEIRLVVQERAALRKQLRLLAAELKEKERICRQAGAEKREAADKMETLRQRQKELDRKLRSIESRMQLLQEQKSEMSGYYRGVREIMQAQRRGDPALSGIVGPVVELVTVPARYTRAIEAALGGGLQDIVTQTEEAARQGIEFLKRFRLGWATFLPLDTLRLFTGGLERYPRWRKVEGALGKASELVQVDPVYRKAVDYLAASTAVVRDLKAATRVAREIEYSCRVVTLEGDLVNPGGALRGGSVSRGGGGMPLGRKQEIINLGEQRAALEEQLSDLDRRLAVLQKHLIVTGAECQTAEKARQEMHTRRERSGRNYRDYYREEIRLRESLARIKTAGAKAQEENAALRERLQEKKRSAQVKQNQAACVMEELVGMEEEYRRSHAEQKELEDGLTGVLLELNTLQEQKRSLQERLDRSGSELAAFHGEETRLEQEMARRRELQESLELEQEGLRIVLIELGEKNAAAMVVVEAHKRELSSVAASLAEVEETDRRRRARLGRLERRERHLAVEESRLRAETSFWKQRFRDLCGNYPPPEPVPGFQPEETENRVASLKEDLEAMGDVNLGAIEELARLEDRLHFLQGQLNDLQQGEQSLHKVLAKIDGSMEQSFNQTFALIQESFQAVFTELFEGGRAVLRLSDPEDVLGSGIEIVAQPPGKKLQNITLLSAGEKVLTALALIFAVLRHNPAPFYLLDEVESALDETNLARFARFLQHASRQAQFILITHRRQTMELADVIYGLTMSEPGVSRLVSVRRDELAG